MKVLCEISLKLCPMCGKEKKTDEYYFCYGEQRKDGTRKLRLKKICKKCTAESAKKWAENNPEKRKEIKRRWSIDNRDHLKSYFDEYKKRNPDFLKRWRKSSDQKKFEEITDSYVMKCLLSGTSLRSEILLEYPELIEIQRLIIKTKRLCKTSRSSEKA